ncbi:unnamed protein product [Ectocarpus sp. 6 AP-2014]
MMLTWENDMMELQRRLTRLSLLLVLQKQGTANVVQLLRPPEPSLNLFSLVTRLICTVDANQEHTRLCEEGERAAAAATAAVAVLADDGHLCVCPPVQIALCVCACVVASPRVLPKARRLNHGGQCA